MDLSKRAFSVLCAVVELYIRSGEPIASKRVARHSGLGLSPATMRNVMADLEECGYLNRPHSSAGSVPSDLGFRVYIDHMPRLAPPSAAVRSRLAERIQSMRRELEEDIDWVAELVAEATHEAGVAVRPVEDGPVLEAVSLVLLGGRRVLGVIVTDDGTVEKRVLEMDRDRSREELQTIANFLTRNLAGLPIDDVSADHESLVARRRSQESEQLRSEARRVARQFFTSEEFEVEVRVAGTEYLLGTADFSEIDRVRSLMAALQNHNCIAGELRRAFAGGRTQVLIGDESEATASGGLGIVATLFYRDDRRAGAVGVVGPRRLDYQKIVPVVEYIGDTLTQMLETPGASHA